MRVWHDLGATEELLATASFGAWPRRFGRWMDVTADGVESTAVWSPAGMDRAPADPVVSAIPFRHAGGALTGLDDLVVSGDTAPPAGQRFARADVLVHEATYLEEHADRAEGHLHSTAAGPLARPAS